MPIKLLSCLSLLALLTTGALAQTGRIAALSHSGSEVTLATEEEAANFGIPSLRFEADTIVATSDTTAVIHGREGRFQTMTKATRTIGYGPHYYQGQLTEPKSRAAAVRLLQQRYPQAKLIGFDTLAKPAAVPAPELKKHKSKRKQKVVGALFMPPHPGVWLAIVTMLGLAAAGLLLGDESRPAPQPLT